MTRFTLRLPPTLARCIKKKAHEDGRSMQMWIQRKLESALPEGMAAAEALAELREKANKKLTSKVRNG